MPRIECPSALSQALLSTMLTTEGFPTVSFMCADTGKPIVVTMAPSVTVKSCCESVTSMVRTRAPYRTSITGAL